MKRRQGVAVKTEKEAHSIRNGIIATVVGGLILSAVPYTRDIIWASLKFIGHGISSFAQALWHHLTSAVEIPWYALWLLILCIIPTFWRLARWCMSRRNKEPRKSDYKEDIIFGAQWKWGYDWGENPINITPFCPTCHTRLVSLIERYPHKITFQCETCRRDIVTLEGEHNFVIGAIARQIERVLNTGEWKTRVRKS